MNPPPTPPIYTPSTTSHSPHTSIQSNNHTTMAPSQSAQIISQSTVFPATKSTLPDLKLSVSDLPMLSCHYIQKGNLFLPPPFPIPDLIPHLQQSLSTVLVHFPPLAGRLTTDAKGYVYITSNDAGVDFIHASATHLTVHDILSPIHVPDCVKQFFAYDRMVSYDGHGNPLLAVQITELGDGVFIGFSVNHAVVDGTSLWNFVNSFSEVCRGVEVITKPPCFAREGVLISPEVLRVPDGGLKVTFDEHAPLAERVFSFSRESILKLKNTTNSFNFHRKNVCLGNGETGTINANEVMGKQSNDRPEIEEQSGQKLTTVIGNWIRNTVVAKTETTPERTQISSFQSLCALLWRGVTRARKFPESKTMTFRMAVNCRHRLEPKLEPLYFGNAIQSIPTYATAGDVTTNDLKWCAEQLNKNVLSHDDRMVRRFVENWEADPRCFPLGNFDGGMLTMGSSPWFPMLENDLGWGKPVAVRSGRANKFDGKISAFPGREGGGSVDLEVVLSPETMAALEMDEEFMQYVSGEC